jgi:hypothetical protein
VGVCDNGSENGDDQRLADLIDQRGWGTWCALTAIQPNLGFTGGNNAVIKPIFQPSTTRPGQPSTPAPTYVLLLNNDTIVHPGAFKHLVDFMDANPRVGCAGSRLEFPDATPQCSTFRFFDLLNEFESSVKLGPVTRLFRSHTVPMPIPDTNAPADWVAGASLIIRREVVEKVGALDEAYYTYFDDIDYCRSAKDAGWSTWYVPASRVVHLVGQTTGITDAAKRRKRRPQYWFQARRRYWLKHHGAFTAVLADVMHLLGSAVYALRLRIAPGQHAPLPERYLRDFLANSTFAKGFQLNEVQNPALPPGTPNRFNP